MSSILTDKAFIPIGLYHYYYAGLTREEALANLLRSHERNEKVFLRIDHREVDFWYNSFQNGNFDFEQTPTYPELSKLENLPVLDHIIHKVNTDDQISLRQVCKQMRNVIDSENRIYEEIQLKLCNNHVLLTVINAIDNKKTKTIYKRKDEGCEIRRDTEVTQSDSFFIDAALAKFNTTVEKINTKVKKMKIEFNGNVSDTVREQFYAIIVPVLANLRQKLHVENLKVSVCEMQELDDVLDCIEVGALKKLRVNIEDKTYKPFEINTVSNFTTHSSHLNSLTVSSSCLVVNLETIANIPHIVLALDTLTPEELLVYKSVIENSPKLEEHSFMKMDCRDLRNAMKPFATIDEEFEIDEGDNMENMNFKGSFPIPGETNYHIVFEFGHMLTFTKELIDQNVSRF